MKNIEMPETATGLALLYRFLLQARARREQVEEALQEEGLSPTLYETLAQLDRAASPLSLRDLAEGQRCAPSNITQKMDRLEREGLVRRLEDPADRRAVLAEITPEGRERTSAARERLRRLEIGFEASIPAADRAAFERVVDALS